MAGVVRRRWEDGALNQNVLPFRFHRRACQGYPDYETEEMRTFAAGGRESRTAKLRVRKGQPRRAPFLFACGVAGSKSRSARVGNGQSAEGGPAVPRPQKAEGKELLGSGSRLLPALDAGPEGPEDGAKLADEFKSHIWEAEGNSNITDQLLANALERAESSGERSKREAAPKGAQRRATLRGPKWNLAVPGCCQADLALHWCCLACNSRHLAAPPGCRRSAV